MIRINLLPFRAARRKENIRQQISIFCLLVVFVVVSLIYYTHWVDRRIDGLNQEISRVKHEITLYKSKADKVTQIKKKLKNLERKLDIVKSLEAERRGPVTLIDAFTGLIIPDRMWLTSMKTSGKNVVIQGMAYDNKTVADFMTAIETSPLFASVNLKTLQMKPMRGDIQIKSFEVVCQKRPMEKNTGKPKNGKSADK